MSKLTLNIENVKNIPSPNPSQNHEITMNEFPTILKRAFIDYEDTIRQNGNKYFDVFEDVSSLTGIAPMTLRKYTNQFNPEFPPVNKLFLICKVINNYRPIEFLNDYRISLEGNK